MFGVIGEGRVDFPVDQAVADECDGAGGEIGEDVFEDDDPFFGDAFGFS